MNSEVTLAAAFLAGLVSFLSPCVLPLVPGYISMLSGVGMEQLRQGQVPRAGLFSSALAFVIGLSAVFISFGAAASSVGGFLNANRHSLTPIAGALVLLFGFHLLGVLTKISPRTGIIIGAVLVALGIVSLLRHAPLFYDFGAIQFFSLSVIGFAGPKLTRWLNRDVRVHTAASAQPGIWSGFLLGVAFAFGWTPCIGPILTTVLGFAAASATVGRGIFLLAVYSAGLSIPFLLTALGMSQFMAFYKNFRKYLHAVEVFSGALLLFVGALVFVNKLTWLTGKLGFLQTATISLETKLTTGNGPLFFWIIFGLLLAVGLGALLAKNWNAVASSQGKKTGLIIATVAVLIVVTVLADRATRPKVSAADPNDLFTGEQSMGKPAPELTLKNLDDKSVSLSDYKGQVVLVNFWATWCEPCKVEIPWLIEMQQKYGDKGFTILGLAMDEEGKEVVAPFVSGQKFDVDGKPRVMNYPILLSNDAAADKFGGLLGYPTSVLISRDGKQIKRITGLISYDEITKAIESHL